MDSFNGGAAEIKIERPGAGSKENRRLFGFEKWLLAGQHHLEIACFDRMFRKIDLEAFGIEIDVVKTACKTANLVDQLSRQLEALAPGKKDRASRQNQQQEQKIKKFSGSGH